VNRYLAAATIAAAILITIAGYPAYGIIPLGIMIAINGQKWNGR
jgi:hypothetical protein